MAIGEDVLENVFTHHPPKGDQARRYQDIRDAGRALATVIDLRAPDSPEKDAAIDRIREAVMWANAAIACNE